jgi:hypothetical protein
MSLGRASRQRDLRDDVSWFCEETLPKKSVYAVLQRERDRLFPDEMFADLFSDRGRRSVPPSVVATVMVLQRLEGLSDREAVERYSYDARWRFATGVGGYQEGSWGRFAHTVLVDMRARLAASEDPRRIFNVVLGVATKAGLVSAKRVLDSTPLYDAVTTMDTITLIRSAIRSLLRLADEDLERELRSALTSDDEYATAAKPQIDWDDSEAREALIDSRAQDALACLWVLEGRELSVEVGEAAELLARVVGQDLEESPDGSLRIAQRVAKDRVISTVDPQARHGHKTSARGFDGYKGHVAVDPDSEIITATAVSAGNANDASVAEDLIEDLLSTNDDAPEHASPSDADKGTERESSTNGDTDVDRPTLYGDTAYGTGEILHRLASAGIDARCRTQPLSAPGGLFPKSRFDVDLDAGSVTCPAEITVSIRPLRDGGGLAFFGDACIQCPLRSQCTNATVGRTVRVGRYEKWLADARHKQNSSAWLNDYRQTRPKVERKLGHMMRRRHGGRRARMRGTPKVDADFNLLAAAQNLARLAVLGIRSAGAQWLATAT